MQPADRRRAEAALNLAIARAGGVVRLAEELGITHAAISQWQVCPTGRALDIERITRIPRGDLRPDIYPEESTDGDT